MKNKTLHKKLINKLKQGDSNAQYQIFNLYVKSMYNTAFRFFTNRMEAEDIVQESFITAFTKIKTLKDESTFGSWLKQLVINKSISELRKRKVQFSEIDDGHFEISDDELEDHLDPVILHKAIKELPLGARTVINLFAFEGMCHKDIADKLDISESTSKTQFKRAKVLLAEIIKKTYSYED